ncbi:ORF164 [Xestia c-nigrum granulovirus]|uniref:ORF164 n=1 Tax=Xestia c-nigrum granulosis virus TaxID=51677 RepID=Q9PYN2_GVXN|nr:ORF164 [Xestia c-nigrum granulovirus]AAF05278.1 ORF164 [Xestia c-nigrum granulovirus]
MIMVFHSKIHPYIPTLTRNASVFYEYYILRQVDIKNTMVTLTVIGKVAFTDNF